MLRQKGLGEVDQVRYRLIVRIRPVGCKLEGVAGLLGRSLPAGRFLDTAYTCRITVIFGVRPIADDEYLDILIQHG